MLIIKILLKLYAVDLADCFKKTHLPAKSFPQQLNCNEEPGKIYGVVC